MNGIEVRKEEGGGNEEKEMEKWNKGWEGRMDGMGEGKKGRANGEMEEGMKMGGAKGEREGRAGN